MRARIFAEENRKWWTLAAVSFGLFMIMLDNTVVNVALPSMQKALHISLEELEWIVVGYALSFATLMLTGGKLADFFGRRLLFVVGLAVFTGASLDRHRDVPAAPARAGARDLGRDLGDGACDRAARWRAADREDQLELDLLHQRSRRGRGHLHGAVGDRRIARHVRGAAARHPGVARVR